MHSTRSAVLTLALAAAGALSAATAVAGGHPIPQACQGDVARFCPGMAPGDGKFGKCMKEHRSEVSEACRVAAKQERGGHEGAAAPVAGAAPTRAAPVPATGAAPAPASTEGLVTGARPDTGGAR